MRAKSWHLWLATLLPPLLCGCMENAYVLKNQVASMQQQQLAIQTQNRELEARAKTLDEDNQELETLLAQSRQRTLVIEDQLAAVRDQLSSLTSELTAERTNKTEIEKRATALSASLRRSTGASIKANSSLRDELPAVHIAGVEVRQDGDVVRIELPGTKLFAPGDAQFLPGAAALVDQVAREVRQTYPNQMIGVEGHTDSDPIRASRWVSNHQLSIGRATAVYDYMVNRLRFDPHQLMIVGHGSNQPVVSNATEAGKERNRRVELVIYPDEAPAR